MSATEELRRLLDERGVEWWEDAFDCKHRTIFDGENNVRYCVHQLGCVLFISSALSVTPEQAVEATLGRGTCHNVSTTGNFRCSECDAADLDFDKPSFCHGCGARVVS